MFKTIGKVNSVMGVVFTAAVLVIHFDLDDKLMEKAEPMLLKMAKKKAAKKVQAQ